MEEYLKFFLLHFDDYLDTLLGLEDRFSRELIKFNQNLKKEHSNWKEVESIRIDIECKTFIEYLRLNEIALNIDSD